ncbi:hypothetical protein A4A49_33974 [Nicotiana attenuata]|uniref:Uncharacterized protein n=1 Tax=Nicotiana attenuata TaxID=49451 RepID=A0A1J6HVZ7_NICAT|nr:hypothetical protein A4A49_33974 [Nicotiana attenuata]
MKGVKVVIEDFMQPQKLVDDQATVGVQATRLRVGNTGGVGAKPGIHTVNDRLVVNVHDGTNFMITEEKTADSKLAPVKNASDAVRGSAGNTIQPQNLVNEKDTAATQAAQLRVANAGRVKLQSAGVLHLNAGVCKTSVPLTPTVDRTTCDPRVTVAGDWRPIVGNNTTLFRQRTPTNLEANATASNHVEGTDVETAVAVEGQVRNAGQKQAANAPRSVGSLQIPKLCSSPPVLTYCSPSILSGTMM